MSSPLPSATSGITKKRLLKYLVIVFIVAFLAGVIVEKVRLLKDIGNPIKENRKNNLSNYPLVNPLLTCEISDSKKLQEFTPLKNQLNALISSKIDTHQATDISVYFDTRDGRWLGINTETRYVPASLLKVANMIAIFKAAEFDSELLSTRFVYAGGADANQGEHFKSPRALKPGQSYTIEELVKYMVSFSDNNTLPILTNLLTFEQFKSVYTDLGLTIPEGPASGSVDFMTVKSYANFFRILYNATYLNAHLSEKAMEFLTESDFVQGIRAGVPEKIKVARKFGERSFVDASLQRINQKELHDCGIIYYPNRPYLLCVMSRGNNFDRLAENIKEISQLVYQFVENN